MIHGWRELSPFDYDLKTGELYFAVYIGENPVDIIIKNEKNCISAEYFTFDLVEENIEKEVSDCVSRVLCLDSDISNLILKASKAGKEYGSLVEKGWNRPLRSAGLFEDFAKVLFTTNCSWHLTKKMCKMACCEKFSDETPLGKFPFPKPERINLFSEEEIKTDLSVGYRNKALKFLCEKFIEKPDLGITNLNSGEIYDLVLSLKGFGDYSACHIMILLDIFSKIPTDSVVVKYMKNNHGQDGKNIKDFILRHYKVWGEYRWWGFKLEMVLFYLRNQT